VSRFKFCSSGVCLVVLLTPALMFAQEAARLAVTVLDPSDAAVPGAKVTVVEKGRGATRAGETEVTGTTYFNALNPGSYRVEVEKTGFEKYTVEDLQLHARDFQSLRLQVRVAAAEKSEVTVKGEVEGVQIDPSTGTTVNGRYASDIPSNSRSIQALVLMAPGVIYAGGPFGGDVNTNGLRSNTNYYTLDGVSINAGAGGGGGIGGIFGGGGMALTSALSTTAAGNTYNLITLDAMQEFRIQTSTFTPEFGRSPGAQVSLTSRGGSNYLHGSAFGYYRSDKFNASDWFSNSENLRQGISHLADYGGTVGGPLQANKTFFFAAFEGLRLTQPRTAIDSVPDNTVRKLASPGLLSYLRAFPIPNGIELGGGAAQFLSVYSMPASTDAVSLRLDRTLTNHVSTFLRYSYAPSTNASRGGLGSSSNSVQDFNSTSQTLTGAMTFVTRDDFVNDIRVNVSRNVSRMSSFMDTFGRAVVLPDSLIFPSGVDSTLGSYAFNVMGVGGFSKGQSSSNAQNQGNFVFTQSVSDGGHQYRTGVDVRILMPTYHYKPYSVNVSFDGMNGTNGGLLTGTATNSVVRSSITDRYPFYQNYAFYIQDNWKKTNRLTLTYGFRWDVNPAPSARTGQSLLALDSSFNLTASNKLYGTSWFNIAPRFGLAYQLRGSGDHVTLVRSGMGVFYDTGYGSSASAFDSAPYVNSIITTLPAFPLNSTVLLIPGLPPVKPYGMVMGADPNLKSPLVYQWNVVLERWFGSGQSLSVGYVGTAGRRLLRQENAGSFFSTDYNLLQVTTNGAQSNYHGMQVQYRRTLSKRLQSQVAYTYSHSIDTASNDLGGDGFALLLGNVNGSSDFDVRHNLNATASFQIWNPKPAPLRWVLGHWFLDGVFTYRTALPFDVTGILTQDANVDTTTPTGTSTSFFFASVRPDLTGAPIWITDSKAPGGKRLNRAAFTTPVNGFQGTMGRNVLRGFTAIQADLAVRRQFPIGDRFNVQLRLDAFNALNHPNFANPSSQQGASFQSPFFGVATQMLYSAGMGGGMNPSQTSGGPRSVQFSLRLQF
jgi:hypothetical protein